MLLVHLSYLGRLKQSRRLFFIRLVTQRRLHDFLMVLSACMFSSTVKHPPFRALEMALEMLAKASLAADAACRLPSSPSKASKQGRKASKQGRSFLKHDACFISFCSKAPPSSSSATESPSALSSSCLKASSCRSTLRNPSEGGPTLNSSNDSNVPSHPVEAPSAMFCLVTTEAVEPKWFL